MSVRETFDELWVTQTRDLRGGSIITPRVAYGEAPGPFLLLEDERDGRRRMYLSRADHKRYLQSKWEGDPWVRVTDLVTGLAVELRQADCGLGCRCAAEYRLAGGGA